MNPDHFVNLIRLKLRSILWTAPIQTAEIPVDGSTLPDSAIPINRTFLMNSEITNPIKTVEGGTSEFLKTKQNKKKFLTKSKTEVNELTLPNSGYRKWEAMISDINCSFSFITWIGPSPFFYIFISIYIFFFFCFGNPIYDLIKQESVKKEGERGEKNPAVNPVVNPAVHLQESGDIRVVSIKIESPESGKSPNIEFISITEIERPLLPAGSAASPTADGNISFPKL